MISLNKVFIFIIIVALFFAFYTFSHSFLPYSFSVRIPQNVNAKLNEEVIFYITIKNSGFLGDIYNITLTSNSLDVYVSPISYSLSLEPNQENSVPIRLIAYTSLQGRRVEIKVCSSGLVKSYGEIIQDCSTEYCTIQSGKTCIRSYLNLSVSSFSLGSFSLELLIITLLFFAIFVILLGFLSNKRQKPFYGRHH
ncbi:MAG: hypothetical protein QXP34_02015 [Candidatus Aenigmatarchaeota archaeon]